MFCLFTYQTFFRYKPGSTKECTRIKRDKTATRIFNLSPVHPLPSQTVLLSVTANKSQLINFIVEDLKNHKNDLVLHPLIVTGPDPVPIEIVGPSRDSVHGEIIKRNDLRNTHEEADNIILHQVSGYSRTKTPLF